VPDLGVPEVARPGLVQLASIEPQAFVRIREVLAQTPPALRQNKYVGAVRTDLTKAIQGDPSSILAAILSVASGRETSGYEPADFAAGVAFSKDIRMEQPLRTTLRDRLVELLAIPSVVITAKAWDLLLENEHNFRSSRVLTDLRPIFVTGQQGPSAGLVLHQLRITHGTQHSDADIVITMDDIDLLQLLEALLKAQRKSEDLRSALSGTKINVLKQEP
jgi:hypothetical protein